MLHSKLSPKGPRIAVILASVFVLIGVLRIASTWHLVSETADEAYHIACGMEWWGGGQYTYETQHPPLSRILVALGPYAAGMPYHQQKTAPEERALIENAPDWEAMLTRARAGNLVFFVLACLAVWLLARACAGPIAAGVAV